MVECVKPASPEMHNSVFNRATPRQSWPDHIRPRDPADDFNAESIVRGVVRSPENAREVMQFGNALAEQLLLSSPLATAYDISISIKKLSESTAKRVSYGQQAEDDLRRTKAYQIARNERKRAGRQRVPGGGILYAEDAREAIAPREEEELEMLEEKEIAARVKANKNYTKQEAKAAKSRAIKARVADRKRKGDQQT
jgi:hypothetical protein